MKLSMNDVLTIAGVRFDWTTLLEDSPIQVMDNGTGEAIRMNAYNDGNGNFLVGEDRYLDITEEQFLKLEVVKASIRKGTWGWKGIDVFVNIDK